ncbi:MAG: OmpA family protein, partial [Desulfobulbaceae bacterium]|nr:OmpA family protein [Desulfobulbaceae bacterium]
KSSLNISSCYCLIKRWDTSDALSIHTVSGGVVLICKFVMDRYRLGGWSLKLLVVGHTDNVGTLSSNMELSKRRADAVISVLVSQYTIDRNRLSPVGVSFASPIAPNSNDEGRAKNRRVELVPNS